MFSVVLVTGGRTNSVELLDSEGKPVCSLPDLPLPFFSHTQTGLVMCGGSFKVPWSEQSNPHQHAACLTFKELCL